MRLPDKRSEIIYAFRQNLHTHTHTNSSFMNPLLVVQAQPLDRTCILAHFKIDCMSLEFAFLKS